MVINLPGSLRLTALDLTLTIFVILSFIIGQINKHLLRPILLVSLSFAISLLASQLISSVTVSAFLYLARFLLYLMLFLTIQKQDLTKIKNYAFISISVFVALGFLQYILIPDTRVLAFLGYDDHYYRLIGSFFDPNFTGLILSLIALSFVFKGKYFSPLTILSLIALILTFSRSSYLIFIIGLTSLVIWRKQYQILLLVPVLLLAIFIAPKPFGEGVNLFRTYSITSRLTNSARALTTITKSPLLGVGFNNYKPTSDEIPNLSSGVDNSFLFVLATTGIIGFTTYLYFLYKFLKQSQPMVRYLILLVCLHSFFNNSLFYSWVIFPLALLSQTNDLKELT